MKRGVAGAARGIATAVPAALFVAAAGTALHRQSALWSGVEVPWGVAAALVLLASVQLWLAAWTRSIAPTAVAGVVSYAAVGFLSSAGAAKQLFLGDAVGNVWVFGIGAVTMIMLVVVSRLRFGKPAAAVAAEPLSRR
jgi:N-acetyl-1-D-myo-inositol-2-amino-2-deoxy-alpha-D-glucopyranoside deacetylase